MSVELVIEASKHTLETPKADWEQHDRLVQVRENLLPAEAAARAELDVRIAELARNERAEEKGMRLGLSILSPEIFSWRKGSLPAFAVFAIDGDGECVISTDPAKEKIPGPCKTFYRNAFKERLTSRIERFFSDNFKAIWCASAFVVEAAYFYGVQASVSATWGKFLLGLTLGVLASFCASLMLLVALAGVWTIVVRKVERTAFARFAGTIPRPVKQKIQRFQSEFKEILIVAEANWALSEKKMHKVPASCDPLVVGWDGDYFWLIDRFDTTSIEQLASDEFAVKPDDLEAGVLKQS